MKSLAISPCKGTGNTNDVKNSPLFLDCCYFKIASTRYKAIPIASPNKFVFLNTGLVFNCLLVLVSLIKIRLLKSINRLKKGTTFAKQKSFNIMCRSVTSFYIYRK